MKSVKLVGGNLTPTNQISDFNNVVVLIRVTFYKIYFFRNWSSVCGFFFSEKSFCSARDGPGGVSLGLQRFGINMWWQGKGGMILNDMYEKIKTLLKVNDKPQYLILHCAANDIGKTKLKELIENVKTTLGKIQLLLPDTKIIRSQLLPRRR